MSLFKRALVAGLTAAVAGAALIGTAAPASAAVIGSVAITPVQPSIDDFTQFSGTVTSNCPSGTDDAIFLMEGPGIEPRTSLLGDPAETTTGPYSFSGASIANIKSTTGGFTQDGQYSIELFCQDQTGVSGDIFQTLINYTAGNPGSFTIVAAADVATSTTVTAAPSGPVTQGTEVTLTADVTPTSGPDTPAGTVEFFNGATSLGAGSALSASGVSTLATTALPVADNSITAVYTPTAGSGFTGSTSAPVTVTVTAAPVDPVATTAVLVVSPTSGPAYQAVTFTCTVSPATGTAAPTGTVRILDGTTVIVGNVPVTNGVATVTANNASAPGPKSFTCEFMGTAPFTNSTSAAVTATYDALQGTPDEQTVVVTIPAGALTITTPYTPEAPLDLGSAVLDQTDSTYSASAAFEDINITDTRAGNLGFTASLVAGDFINGTSSFPGQHAGFTDVTAVQVPGNALQASAVVTTDTEPVTPGIGTPTTFASYPAGGPTGSVDLTATFEVDGVPTSVSPGLYTSTVTFTAF